MTPWWKTAIVYQIYPRSLRDADGDGVGDLRGITEKLDYFTWLGVNALWLSPVFRSPMVDFGYDVSDYCDIDPLFGTLADFDALLAGAHARGLKVILDLVPNHTSDQHAWFQASRASRDHARRDWYIWRDPAPGGGPPNNWQSYFGGPAWTLDTATGQYYLHNFAPQQPDLNYRNPEVRAAMFDQIRFWLDRGVDGFRIDVIDRMMKHPDFPDNPPDPNWQPGDADFWRYRRVYSENQDGIHELIADMGDVFRGYDDRVSIGEIAYSTDPAFITGFAGTPGKPQIDLPFNFAPLMLPWDAAAFRHFVDAYDAAVPEHSFPNYVLGNHDQKRVATRLGEAQSRFAAVMLFTLRGVPFIYQGEELGLTDGEVASNQYRDPQGINVGISRDGCRTPFHWDGTPGAGFSTSPTPWLPIASSAPELNVEAERNDPYSVLRLYRLLITLRRIIPALTAGTYRSYDAPEDVFLYEREAGDSRVLVALNFGPSPRTVALPPYSALLHVLASSYSDQDALPAVGETIALRPHEGVIIG
jgi:alpha-glucosidase